MKPISFPQMTGTLSRPSSMTDDECSPLPVNYTIIEGFVSCWQPTWRERLAVLFGRPVWLRVLGQEHPPVAVEVQNPFDLP